MNIFIERSFKCDSQLDEISSRLDAWAMKYQLICVDNTSGNWIFKRGTHLMASITFDVRKVPTTVVVTKREDTSDVHCSISVKSIFNIATPGDPRRVEEQIELLQAYIKGCFAN